MKLPVLVLLSAIAMAKHGSLQPDSASLLEEGVGTWRAAIQRQVAKEPSTIFHINKFLPDDSVSELFNKLDADNDGTLSVHELETANLPYNMGQVLTFAHTYDANQDQRLQPDEFAAAHGAFFAQTPAPKTNFEEYQATLNSNPDKPPGFYKKPHDAYRKGPNDLFNVLSSTPGKVTPDDVNGFVPPGLSDEVQRFFDANGGILDQNSFSAAYHQFRGRHPELENQGATSNRHRKQSESERGVHFANDNEIKGHEGQSFISIRERMRQRRGSETVKDMYNFYDYGSPNAPTATNLQVTAIVWSQDTPYKTEMDTWFKQVLPGYYLSAMPQYKGSTGTPQGSATYAGMFVDGANQWGAQLHTDHTPKTVSESDAKAWLSTCLQYKSPPPPGPASLTTAITRIYVFFFPTWITFSMGSGTTPNGCQNYPGYGTWCAYHGSWPGPTTSLSTYVGQATLFAMMPSCAVCGQGSALDRLRQSTSHEIAEAISDAMVNQKYNSIQLTAWIGDCSFGCEEIGDVCEGQAATVSGYTDGLPYSVQPIWDASSNACTAGCFPGSATVETESGERVRMDQLRIGDRIRSVNEQTAQSEFTTVYAFLDKQPNVVADFVVLTHSDGKEFTVSPFHLVYRYAGLSTLEAVHARTVQVGDVIHVDDRKVVVEAKSFSRQTGWYAPATLNGNLVVDGVMVSSYSMISSHYWAHLAFAPIRALARLSAPVVESQWLDGVVSWYSQWLRESVVDKVLHTVAPSFAQYLFPLDSSVPLTA